MGIRPSDESSSLLSSTTLRLYLASVALPLILYAIFVFVIRSPGYVSTADVVVQRDAALSTPSLDLGLFSTSANGVTDALLIQEYIQSLSLLLTLDEEIKFREHYSSPERDIFSRLPADASREKLLRFYGTRVEVRVDGDSYVIHLSVEAYSREFAQLMTTKIVEHAGQFVNRISQDIARGEMSFVEQELEKSNKRLHKATQDLIALQQKNELLSPTTESATLSTIIASLQSEIATRRAALTAQLSYLNENAPEVVAQRQGIAALERQIEQERTRQVGSTKQADHSNKGLSDLFLDYQTAQTAVTVATDSYQVGLRALEASRLEASRNAKHLVQVSAPSLPDESIVPRPFYAITTAFVLLHLGFFILTLIAAAIRDHRDA